MRLNSQPGNIYPIAFNLDSSRPRMRAVVKEILMTQIVTILTPYHVDAIFTVRLTSG